MCQSLCNCAVKNKKKKKLKICTLYLHNKQKKNKRKQPRKVFKRLPYRKIRKEMSWERKLFCAVENNRPNEVERLLNCNAIDINKQDKYGRTALYVASYCGHYDMAYMLLECKDIDVNLQDNLGRTPLFWASLHGHIDMAEIWNQSDVINRLDKFNH